MRMKRHTHLRMKNDMHKTQRYIWKCTHTPDPWNIWALDVDKKKRDYEGGGERKKGENRKRKEFDMGLR